MWSSDGDDKQQAALAESAASFFLGGEEASRPTSWPPKSEKLEKVILLAASAKYTFCNAGKLFFNRFYIDALSSTSNKIVGLERTFLYLEPQKRQLPITFLETSVTSANIYNCISISKLCKKNHQWTDGPRPVGGAETPPPPPCFLKYIRN